MSRSFVSLMFSEDFDISIGALDHLLMVEVTDDRTSSTSRVFKGGTLEIFRVRFLIDLIPVLIGEINIMFRIDQLSQFKALIDCGR